MRHVIIWASSAVMLICAAGASAAPPQLKGRYAVTGSAVCLAAPGFDGLASLSPTPGHPVFSISVNVLATRTYNGDGTGKAEGRQVYITTPLPGGGMSAPTGGQPVPHPSAGSNEFSFKFTYDVDANGIFTTAMVPGSFLGTVTAGPRNGQTYTVDNLFLSGLVSGDNKIIDVATTTPTVEKVEYSDSYVRYQICQRSRVHIYLGQ